MRTDNSVKTRSRFRAGGLFKTIFLTAILCMLIPLAIMAYTTVSAVRGNLTHTTNANLSQLSVEKMNEVDSIIQNQVALTKAVAESPYVAEVVAQQYRSGSINEQQNAVLQDYLGEIFNNANGIYENFFITCGTMGIADGLGGATLHDVTGEPWYDACAASGEFLGNNISPVTGRPVYVISYAVKDPDTGEVVGGLNNSIDLGAMTSSITGSINDENTKVLIIDSDGYIIASQNDSQILQVNFNDENPSTAQAMEKMLSTNSLSGDMSFNFDGVRNVGAFSNSGSMFTLIYMPERVYTSTINALLGRILLVGALCFIVATVCIVFISISITSPLGRIVDVIEIYGNADFTQEISPDLLKRRDEIGILAKSMGNMQSAIRSTVREIFDEADSVNDSVNDSNERMASLTIKIDEVNGHVTDRAAEMEETAASTEVMNQNAANIRSSIEAISNDTNNGKEVSKGISERAQALKQSVVQSRERAAALTEDINKNLRHAIEQSKAVNKINELSAGIMEIGEQTNLLSLNASIEAARAGEHGKGFSVVADEIRKLAEDSQNAVEAIQGITQQVVVAVNNLSDNSEKAISFISNDVINDYQVMVEIGEQYYQDAQSVRDIVEAVNESADELTKAINIMATSINEISMANTEGAEGITNIAHNTSDISESAEHISGMMKSVEESTHRLKASISKFSV